MKYLAAFITFGSTFPLNRLHLPAINVYFCTNWDPHSLLPAIAWTCTIFERKNGREVRINLEEEKYPEKNRWNSSQMSQWTTPREIMRWKWEWIWTISLQYFSLWVFALLSLCKRMIRCPLQCNFCGGSALYYFLHDIHPNYTLVIGGFVVSLCVSCWKIPSLPNQLIPLFNVSWL